MKRQKGFTLVELLIVVVIIGILVSISIPIFTAQMHKAEVAADWANLRAYYGKCGIISILLILYKIEYSRCNADGSNDK